MNPCDSIKAKIQKPLMETGLFDEWDFADVNWRLGLWTSLVEDFASNPRVCRVLACALSSIEWTQEEFDFLLNSGFSLKVLDNLGIRAKKESGLRVSETGVVWLQPPNDPTKYPDLRITRFTAVAAEYIIKNSKKLLYADIGSLADEKSQELLFDEASLEEFLRRQLQGYFARNVYSGVVYKLTPEDVACVCRRVAEFVRKANAERKA